MRPSLFSQLAVSFMTGAVGTALHAQPLVWDGGTVGTGNALTAVANWNPDLAATADLTDKVLRIASANFDPTTVTTSFGIGNILIGTIPQVAGFEFDNAGGYYRLNFGVRLVPTTSTTLVTDRVITFSQPGTLVKGTNNAAASIRRFSTNVGDGTGDIATVIVNLNYVGEGIIDLDATSTFLFQEIKITGTGGLTKTGPGTLTLDSGIFASLSSPPNLTVNPQYNGSTSDSYSGGLKILQGTVSIDSVTRLPSATLNNDGVTPNPDAVIINGGILRFSGGTLGSSANRGFRVGAAGGTLQINATNTRLIGPFADVVGEAGVFIKTGTGNLSLEGASYTFTGGAQHLAGTLTLNSITLGAPTGAGFTAAAGTTLRGSGTINGPATIADTVSIQPGTYVANALTSPVGVLTFGASATLGDVTLAYDLETPEFSDRIEVAPGGTLSIGSGLLDLTSFTLTPTVGFVTGTFPLLVSSQPIVGSLGPVVTGTLGGFDIKLELSPDQTTVVLKVTSDTPLQAWRRLHFGTIENTGSAADLEDPDNDQIPNLLEYALGGLPLIPDFALAPRVGLDAGRLALTFNRVADPALIYTLQASDTLAPLSWVDVWTSTGTGNVSGEVTAIDTVVLTGPARRFVRLSVSY